MSDDAIAILRGEHENLTTLFERVSSPDEDRPKVLNELLKAISGHVSIEEQVLVSVVKEHLPDGPALADDLSDDHHRVEKLLTLIERRKVNSPDLPDFVNELLDIMEKHITKANDVIFPGLRENLSEEQLQQLGEDLTSDERHSLSHSHPVIPDNGPLAGIAGKAAEIIDRVRDRTTDIGRSSS